MASVSLAAPCASIQRPFKSHVYWARTVDTEIRIELCRTQIPPTNNGSFLWCRLNLNRPQTLVFYQRGPFQHFVLPCERPACGNSGTWGSSSTSPPSTSTIKTPWLASRLRQTSFHPATNNPAVDLTSHIGLGPLLPQAATPYDEVRGAEWRNPCSCDAGRSRRCGVASEMWHAGRDIAACAQVTRQHNITWLAAASTAHSHALA
ncbi:hypothetical protein EDB80DRAFT_131433 [Ilyonectria destructans]|nr:hypothetical protein EDB80DRAFT_131433 [Ilyonectria destructans]